MKRIIDPLKADIYDFFVEFGEMDIRRKKGATKDEIYAAVTHRTFSKKFNVKQLKKALKDGYLGTDYIREKATGAILKVYYWSEDQMPQRFSWKVWLEKTVKVLKFWDKE